MSRDERLTVPTEASRPDRPASFMHYGRGLGLRSTEVVDSNPPIAADVCHLSIDLIQDSVPRIHFRLFDRANQVRCSLICSRGLSPSEQIVIFETSQSPVGGLQLLTSFSFSACIQVRLRFRNDASVLPGRFLRLRILRVGRGDAEEEGKPHCLQESIRHSWMTRTQPPRERAPIHR